MEFDTGSLHSNQIIAIFNSENNIAISEIADIVFKIHFLGFFFFLL